MDLQTKKVMVYRNEDTGWGFPWYLKFDSADVQAKAQGYSRDAQQLAVIRYYGWRIQILSMFPNITDIESTSSRSEPFPVFNAVLFSSLVILFLVIFVAVKSRLKPKTRGQVPI